MSLNRKYARAIHEHTGYRATWMPAVRMRLGDVGVITGGVFERSTDLGLLQIPYARLRDNAPESTFNFSTNGVRSVDTKLAGETDAKFQYIAEAKAGVRVEFSGKNAVVVRTKGVQSQRIDDVASLDAAMLALVRPGPGGAEPTWRSDWVVITEVIQADVATILASADQSGAVELEASGALGPDGLVDADAGFTAHWSGAALVDIVAKEGLTPFFKARRIRRKWLWLWGLEAAPADSTPPENADDLFEDDEFEVGTDPEDQDAGD